MSNQTIDGDILRNGSVPLAKIEPIANNTMLGNSSGVIANPSPQTALKLLTSPGEYWPDIAPGATIHRLKDRLLLGKIDDGLTGNRLGSQGSYVPTSAEGANWALRDSQMLTVASTGLMAVTGYSRSNDQTEVPNACIGVSGFVINNKTLGRAWGLYSDLQHEPGAAFTTGIEIAAKNKAADVIPGPYGLGSGAVYGIWLAAGGDNAYGGSAANPSAAGIVFKKNASTWNRGIVFEDDSITGTDGVTGTGVAISLAKGQAIRWESAANTPGFDIRSDNAVSGARVSIIASQNVIQITGSNGNRIFQTQYVSNTVNFLNALGSVTGDGPSLESHGVDADIDLNLTPKGTGQVIGPVGSASKPAFTFSGDTDVGVYRSSSNILSFASQGAEQFRIGSTASAVNILRVSGGVTGNSPSLSAVSSTDTNVGIFFSSQGTGALGFFTNNTAQQQFSITHTASAVNRLNITGAIASSGPVLSAIGSDTNIDMLFTPKGTGVVRYGTHSAVGIETVTGYITIKDSGGTTRKLAVVS